ncbi:anion permease [Citrobacter sp. UYEF32]|uniref:anion permease n=1 Tax=Citrobacter sp. UYEF32 TaxID=3156347 RepID=UPI003391096A
MKIRYLFASGGCITHYGGAAGPITFAAGYNDIKSWWITGTIVEILTFVTHITVGFPWWAYLKSSGML